MSRSPATCFILAGLVLVLAACDPEKPEITQVVFSPERVTVAMSRSLEIQSAEINTENDTRLARTVFSNGFRGREVKVDFNWSENSRYRVRVKTNRGDLNEVVISPERKRDVPFSFDFPFGMHGQRAVVPGRTEITGSLQVKNDSSLPRHFDVYLRFSEGFRIVDRHDRRYRPTADGTVEFHDRVELANQYDSRVIGITVMSPDQTLSASGKILLKIIEDQKLIFQRTLWLRMLGPDTLSHHIQVTGIDFPTDVKGERDQRLMQDILQLAPLSQFLAFITGKAQDEIDHRMIPYGFYTVELTNTMREDVAVIVRAWVEDKSSGGRLEAFRPHLHVNAAGEIFSSAILPGNGRQRVIMPIYVEPALVLPGKYRLCHSLTQFGTTTPFYSNTHDFIVAKQPMVPMAVTAAGGVVAGTFIPFLIIFFKRIYGHFKVRWIILAALYGAVGLVGVNIPGLFLANLFHALLGPFSFLATGLFYGVVQYMLWGSLITLIPKKGMMTLVMTVRMLLAGVMLGYISAVFMISVFVQAFLVELLLWFTGCTRSNESAQLNAKALILAFILSDVLATFFNFESSILLYRLYYADWYIFLNCIISGVLYTFIGTRIGSNMGNKLKMVVE